MNIFEDIEKPDGNCTHDGQEAVQPGATDTKVQLAISLLLGVSAFLAFCTLRPRWKSLYSARKRRWARSVDLPALPDTFFGWIPVLYRITEQQILQSAGLDAYVFLNFFKFSVKLFSIMLFFAAVVLQPINRHFIPDKTGGSASSFLFPQYATYRDYDYNNARSYDSDDDDGYESEPDNSFNRSMGYLWSYLIFTYFFTGLTLYMLNKETLKVIRIRQDYLGTQSTITDRTFRLSGIPKELRTETAIKELVEKLEIGKVETVTLCCNWKEIDELIEKRQGILAKLEETWSVYLGQKALDPAQPLYNGNGGTPTGGNNSVPRTDEEAVESDGLLSSAGGQHVIERERPTTRFWYGFLRLQIRKTDALDYYTEKLRVLDEKILMARKKTYEPADLAFVTMDSIAACQMAIQALIDPRPGCLFTKPAPAPSDIVWRNTYRSRTSRRIREWTITVFVVILSIIWLAPVAALASTVSICTIRSLFPSLAEYLQGHEILRSLIQTGLPTLAVSLLNVAVPYFYDFLSYHQGMLSQGDIALSVVSKNFFFVFFNIFLIFTVFGAVGSIWGVVKDSFKDTTYIAYRLAKKIENLNFFYTNFIMLQGLGLFPFRLLQFGSVSLYPIYRMGAKTPRDFAQIVQPPMFYYGFYLPTALLVFILCLVYSALPYGFLVLALGVAYFSLGYFTYKYQLLYAMDQPQHATGGAWRMICYRIVLGLMVFQLTMSGYLALRKAFTVALLVIPLAVVTMWYSWSFKKHFEPLTKFISLRSIKRKASRSRTDVVTVGLPRSGTVTEEDVDEPRASRRRGSTVDEDKEKGLRFVNPSMVVPLEQPWIYQEPPAPFTEEDLQQEFDTRGSEREYEPEYFGSSGNNGASGSSRRARSNDPPISSNSSSSMSLGDTHIWRE
ncbi:hypothetical protein QBC38DRAFT_479443 [Podospora fimiseda]|uniref:DUF221-domain-containing protein n=1 Tax=Podospora fimiseda TaxID=252190 RepID=A0AAN7H1M4_9PEZI|nr:hypothetical protein QBC38DRAFT_479443 [Podospora fimiseda]